MTKGFQFSMEFSRELEKYIACSAFVVIILVGDRLR